MKGCPRERLKFNILLKELHLVILYSTQTILTNQYYPDKIYKKMVIEWENTFFQKRSEYF